MFIEVSSMLWVSPEPLGKEPSLESFHPQQLLALFWANSTSQALEEVNYLCCFSCCGGHSQIFPPVGGLAWAEAGAGATPALDTALAATCLPWLCLCVCEGAPDTPKSPVLWLAHLERDHFRAWMSSIPI